MCTTKAGWRALISGSFRNLYAQTLTVSSRGRQKTCTTCKTVYTVWKLACAFWGVLMLLIAHIIRPAVSVWNTNSLVQKCYACISTV